MVLTRWLMVLVAAACSWTCAGQAVMADHLIISLAGGGGLSTLRGTSDPLEATGLASSAVRFTFGYAMSARLSLGGHYDRIGSVVHPGDVDRVRATTYMIEGTYRPYIGMRGALETTLGMGGAILVIRLNDQLVPYSSRAPAYNVAVRYLHSINGAIGVSLAVDHAQAFQRELTHETVPVHLSSGPLRMAWHSQRFTAGMYVRF